jgi:hypothetical protein
LSHSSIDNTKTKDQLDGEQRIISVDVPDFAAIAVGDWDPEILLRMPQDRGDCAQLIGRKPTCSSPTRGQGHHRSEKETVQHLAKVFAINEAGKAFLAKFAQVLQSNSFPCTLSHTHPAPFHSVDAIMLILLF